MKNSLATMVLAVAAMMPAEFANAQGEQGGLRQSAFNKVSFSPIAALPSFESTRIESSTSESAPDTTTAWLMALGFLGLVIIRRTRSHD